MTIELEKITFHLYVYILHLITLNPTYNMGKHQLSFVQNFISPYLLHLKTNEQYEGPSPPQLSHIDLETRFFY